MSRPTCALLLACFSLLFAPYSARAQSIATLEGTVHSDDGDPLPNVTVLVSDYQGGTATDVDGNYQLSKLPSGNLEVTFSMVGYQSQVSRWQKTEEHTSELQSRGHLVCR